MFTPEHKGIWNGEKCLPNQAARLSDKNSGFEADQSIKLKDSVRYRKRFYQLNSIICIK